MKVILSRKGSDTVYGGLASPILPTNEMRSIPIPSKSDKIKYDNLTSGSGLNYGDILAQLQSTYRKKRINTGDSCHLDPDIYEDIIERPHDWRALFGQIGKAQQHLTYGGVQENDLFLFFGWFKRTEIIDGIFKYSDNFDLHVIFGYLQIGKIINPKADGFEKWMEYHPHIQNKERYNDKTNRVYIARETSTWDKSIPGSGFFDFDKQLILTKKTKQFGYLPKSHWKNEFPFDKSVKISRHKESAWKDKNYFQSTPIGQEFVFEKTKEVENWAKNLIKNNIRTRDIS